jgi:glycosyltransferase involved in cell wall biosynthesis
MSRQRMLILTRDATSARLGGNAIRATELARVLSDEHDVTLASPGEDPGLGIPHVRWHPASPGTIAAAVRDASTVLAMPQDPATHALLKRSGARLIFDLYDPYPLEVLEAFADAPLLQRRLQETITGDSFVQALRLGHHFVCASERQRDLWLGAMLALGLLRGDTYREDPTFRERLDVVPIGLSEDAPQAGAGAREHFGLAAEDEVIVWLGGLWNWVDPLTAVRAMALLRERRPRARLVVIAALPTDGPSASVARGTHQLAGELGLTGTTILFTDERVPYAERGAWLLQGDCGLSLHVDQLETRFAFRTRLLDYFWAGVPVVCTGGDDLGDLVASERLGEVAPPADPEAVARGLEAVLDRGRDAYAPALERVAREFTWSRVSQPLRRMLALERPARLGDAARLPARPGPPARALLIRALRAAQRTVSR